MKMEMATLEQTIRKLPPEDKLQMLVNGYTTLLLPAPNVSAPTLQYTPPQQSGVL
jgi:hypothetical protein